MGRGHLHTFLGMPDVQVVGVCDVVAERRESARDTVEKRYADQRDKAGYKGCVVYRDFRDLLARSDLDAVVIATPDHWHALPCVLAARAGKHVYCEKPLTRTIGEGRRVVAAAVASSGRPVDHRFNPAAHPTRGFGLLGPDGVEHLHDQVCVDLGNR